MSSSTSRVNTLVSGAGNTASVGQRIYTYVVYFFLYVYIIGFLLVIIDTVIKKSSNGIVQFEYMPGVTKLDEFVSDMIFFLFGLGGAILNFVSDLLFHGHFDIAPLTIIFIKFGSYIGYNVLEIPLNLFQLPFRLLTLLNGSAPWIGIKLTPQVCDYGCGASDVPSYAQFFKGNTIVVYIGFDLNGAFDAGAVIHTTGVTIPKLEIPFFGTLGGDTIGNEKAYFMGTFALAEVQRSTSKGLVKLGAFGVSYDVFLLSILNSQAKASIQNLLVDYFKNINDTLGSWQCIFNKIVQHVDLTSESC